MFIIVVRVVSDELLFDFDWVEKMCNGAMLRRETHILPFQSFLESQIVAKILSPVVKEMI